MKRWRRRMRRMAWHLLLILPGLLLQLWRCQHGATGWGICFAGCCEVCFTGCTAFEDDLSGGFSDTSWESSGSMEIVKTPMCDPKMRVTISVVSGGKAFIQYNPETGAYYWAQWSGGVLTVGGYDTEGESEEELSSCDVDDPPSRITLCLSWYEGSLRATADDVFAFAVNVAETGGLYAGVFTSGSPENFVLSVASLTGTCRQCYGESCIETTSCSACDGQMPTNWLVTMPSFEGTSCLECDIIEGSYLLTAFHAASCGIRKNLIDLPCSAGPTSIFTIQFGTIPTTGVFRLDITYADFSGVHLFFDSNVGTDYDCYSAVTGFVCTQKCSAHCDWSGGADGITASPA